MVSIPLEVYNRSAGDIFLDDLGSYDKSKWRLYRYQSGDYVEYSDGNLEDTEPGKSYWLITKETKSWDTGSGLSVESTTPVRVTLQPGWNMIGCPYSFPVSWIAVDRGGASMDAPVGYSGNINENEGYDYNQTILYPWRGYLLRNTSGATAVIQIPANEVAAAEKEMIHVKGKNAGEWEIEIVVLGGRYRDRGNCIGVYDDADETWDTHDYMEVPAFGEYVRMVFPHDDWDKHSGAYSGDYRSRCGNGHEWHSVIETRGVKGEIRVEFRGIENLPETREIRFVDENLKRVIDPREEEAYRFIVSGDKTERPIRILVGERRYVEEQTETITRFPDDSVFYPNYPNPFNSRTLFRFSLPGRSRVSLRIYDVMGREVRILIAGRLEEAGIHEVLWDGRDKNGESVSSGIYVVFLRSDLGMRRQKVVFVE